MSRVAILVAALVGCTAAQPPAALSLDEIVASEDDQGGHLGPVPLAEPPRCPPGTERRERGGEGPDAADWWCAQGDVRHGPFHERRFDERERTWYDVEGQYRDGERHGNIDYKGFYQVAYSGSPRVFRRDVHDRGHLVRSNEAQVDLVLDAQNPVAHQRFMVQAAGFPNFVPWGGEDQPFGVVDAEVSAQWTQGPADATPSVLRVEVSTSLAPGTVRADGLLYALQRTDLPEIASSLPLGELPLASARWSRCDPPGCELWVDVTLRWLVPGPGRVEAHVETRAVPEAWPQDATIDVRLAPPHHEG